MASIERLTARIDAVGGAPDQRRMIIEYALRMHYWEAGSWFSEVVEVYAGRPEQANSATLLLRLTCNPWKLDESASLTNSKSYLLARSVPPQELTMSLPAEIFACVRLVSMLPKDTGSCCTLAEPVSGTAP